MIRVFAGLLAGSLTAQSVGGPVLGYVVDGAARMRPVYGMAAAAHVGAPVLDGVADTWGELALLQDGRALRGGMEMEGRWAALQPGAFLDATGRDLLIAPPGRPAWRLALPDRALAVRVSGSGERVITLLADESLAVWGAGGRAESRTPAGAWWSIAFAGERAVVYDPANHSLLWLQGDGQMELLRKLEGPGGQYSLAADAAGRYAVLLGGRALVIPLSGGAVRVVDVPEGSERLEAVRGGRAFLLTRNPARPMWVLDPEREDPLLVIPALGGDAEDRR